MLPQLQLGFTPWPGDAPCRRCSRLKQKPRGLLPSGWTLPPRADPWEQQRFRSAEVRPLRVSAPSAPSPRARGLLGQSYEWLNAFPTEGFSYGTFQTHKKIKDYCDDSPAAPHGCRGALQPVCSLGSSGSATAPRTSVLDCFAVNPRHQVSPSPNT